VLFLAGQGRKFRRSIRKKDPEQKKNHETVTQNIQYEEQEIFGDEIVRIPPWDPFEESLEENLHQVSTSIGQIGNRPVHSRKSQRDREKCEEDSAKNGIPNEFAAHVNRIVTRPMAQATVIETWILASRWSVFRIN
jgi:hypothetical protein